MREGGNLQRRIGRNISSLGGKKDQRKGEKKLGKGDP